MKLNKYIPDEFRNVDWTTQLGRKKISLLVGTGTWMGYVCFNHPFTWNFRTERLCYVTGSFHHMVRKFYLVLAVAFTVIQGLSIAYDISQDTFNITSLLGIYRALSVIYCTFPTVIQINLAMMPEEAIQFANYSMQYFEMMQREIFANQGKANKFDIKCVIAMLLIASNIYFTQVVGLIAYAGDCRFHPLSSAFPICDPSAYDGDWHPFIGHPNIWVFIPSFILLYIATMQLVCATIGFMFLLMCPILGCGEVLGKMCTPVEELPDGDAFQDRWNWLIHYRILQMLLARINVFVGQYVIPIVLLLSMTLNIGITYILFGIEDEPMFKVAGIVINTIVIATTTFTVKQSASFVELSEDAVNVRREALQLKGTKSDESGFSRSLDTCRPLYTDIGPFMKIEKVTILEIYAVIQEYTTELLLLDS